VPGDRGIFLPVSRRMHPGVCKFISKAVYEDRLTSHPSTATQFLLVDGKDMCGARLELVEHEGCSQQCPEEVEAIRATIARLRGSAYRDCNGEERIISDADILVVAPYNAQVNALRLALPGIRVGTVDKFQGQEAPICLISMTTSSVEEMPRDMSFLFSLNRINVAVSRAQAQAIVFASPRLLEVPCRTVEDMILANTLCLLGEHGEHKG
jgi:superfamily I DNA and/or RNA helicase